MHVRAISHHLVNATKETLGVAFFMYRNHTGIEGAIYTCSDYKSLRALAYPL